MKKIALALIRAIPGLTMSNESGVDKIKRLGDKNTESLNRFFNAKKRIYVDMSSYFESELAKADSIDTKTQLKFQQTRDLDTFDSITYEEYSKSIYEIYYEGQMDILKIVGEAERRKAEAQERLNNN
jgi:hypothetical protein